MTDTLQPVDDTRCDRRTLLFWVFIEAKILVYLYAVIVLLRNCLLDPDIPKIMLLASGTLLAVTDLFATWRVLTNAHVGMREQLAVLLLLSVAYMGIVPFVIFVIVTTQRLELLALLVVFALDMSAQIYRAVNMREPKVVAAVKPTEGKKEPFLGATP